MRSRKAEGGWTLLECMIVVSIIGVMALIAIPTWTAARDRSQREVCTHNQRLIFEQMNIYCLERNKACDVTTFADIEAVKAVLVPADSTAKYIKRLNAFSCPGNYDQTVQADYRFVRDGNLITDVECDHVEDHNS